MIFNDVPLIVNELLSVSSEPLTNEYVWLSFEVESELERFVIVELSEIFSLKLDFDDFISVYAGSKMSIWSENSSVSIDVISSLPSLLILSIILYL